MGKKKTAAPLTATQAPLPSDAPTASPPAPEAPTSPPAHKAKAKPPIAPDGPPPPLRIVARGPGVLRGYGGPEWGPCPGYELPGCGEGEFAFAPDGQVLVAEDAGAGAVGVYDAVSGARRTTVAEPRVVHVAVSPKSTFLVTQRRPEKEDAATLAVWHLATGQEACRLPTSKWPALAWSADEALCVRGTPQGLLVLPGADLTAEPLEGGRLGGGRPDEWALAPAQPPYLAVFYRRVKAQPAELKVYRAPNLRDALVHKSMFKADTCALLWNSLGTALIANCKTDHDASGKSYYGESLLYLVLPKQKEVLNVVVGKSGEQVHDVAFAPAGGELIVISGAMPHNKATLYNLRAEPVFEFGTSPRNTVAWAPNSRFIALCGFGNLAGEVQFWDRRRLDKGTGRIGSYKVTACTEFAWAPDSRSFLCAVTAPRMKVDNKFTLVKHNGVELYTAPFPGELYQVGFRPEKSKLYPQREPSPVPPEHRQAQVQAAPALFKARGGSGLSDMLRRDRAAGHAGAVGPNADQYIPGMPPPKPKAAAKKAAKAPKAP